jgi:transposase
MTAEELRNRIVAAWQAGASGRAIARELGVSRSTVRETLRAYEVDRAQIEQLASCGFLRRKDNFVLVGQSGLGKSKM